MNKFTKRMLPVILAVSVSITGAGMAYAEDGVDPETVEIEYTKEEKEAIKEAREDMAEELSQELASEEIADMSQREVDELMADVMEENYGDVAEDIRDRKEEQGGAGTAEVESNMPAKTYDVGEDVSITFSDDTVALNVIEEGPEMDAEDSPEKENVFGAIRNFVLEPSYAASGSKSKTASNKTTLYDALTKKKCFQVFLEVKFTYNKKKKKCTCETLSHYAKKYSIATLFSEVHDREYTVNTDNKSKRSCSQSGYIRTGAQVKGVGLVLSDYYACATLSCNHKGKISKYNKTA